MTSFRFSPPPGSFSRLGPIVLVGHRGSGKSTLGRRCAELLGLDFFDVDHLLREELGPDFSAVLTESPEVFRRRERELLEKLIAEHPGALIAPGAGAHPIPEQAFVVWLDREDWKSEVAQSQRPRVRPELSIEDEWRWMEETREPRWQQRAHLRLPISRGRTLQRAENHLRTLLSFAAMSPSSSLAKKTFLVPAGPEELPRANRDARRLGFAGIEIRSDFFAEPPGRRDMPFIASLRHPDPDWLKRTPHPRAWDIDLEFLPALLDRLPPRLPLTTMPAEIILSLHPDHPSPADLEALARAARSLYERGFPYSSMILKYAPRVETFEDLQRCLSLESLLQATPAAYTLLPQGPAMAWTRPILAATNATNYLPVGLRDTHPEHPSALDLGDFLPHLAGASPSSFDALLGDPVAASQGDLWHRRVALQRSEEHRGYLKIPVPQTMLSSALAILETLPIRGLSITAPLKREAAENPFVDNPEELPAINTLRRSANPETPWIATDTDQCGMKASLEELTKLGISPGPTIVFGRGGASFALLRALEEAGWEVVAHLSARAGWPSLPESVQEVELIVNAAGPQWAFQDREKIPSAKAWLDLHYQKVSAPPVQALHLQGDLFFEAQAEAQRQFWNQSEF